MNIITNPVVATAMLASALLVAPAPAFTGSLFEEDKLSESQAGNLTERHGGLVIDRDLLGELGQWAPGANDEDEYDGGPDDYVGEDDDYDYEPGVELWAEAHCGEEPVYHLISTLAAQPAQQAGITYEVLLINPPQDFNGVGMEYRDANGDGGNEPFYAGYVPTGDGVFEVRGYMTTAESGSYFTDWQKLVVSCNDTPIPGIPSFTG